MRVKTPSLAFALAHEQQLTDRRAQHGVT